MQFACDSCKTTLQIADEKVRGKRLVVKCKRCGARITISDPLLSGGTQPRIVAPGAGTQASIQPVPKAAPRPVAPKPAPPPAAEEQKPLDDGEEHDSDTESTRAMDSDVLEKALQASKQDDAASVAMAPLKPAPAAPAKPAAPPPKPPPPAAAAPPPRDPPIWFAMLAGKQEGPFSRAELGLKTATGAVGPRTYLWKDGMASWTRAKEVTELSSLFAEPPPPPAAVRPPPPPAKPPPPPPRPAAKEGMRDFNTADFERIDLNEEAKTPPAAVPELELHTGLTGEQPAAAPAQSAGHAAVKLEDDDGEDNTSVDPLPLGERVHQEDVAKELFNSGESTGAQSALDLAKWASSELGKKKDTSPEHKRAASPAPVPSPAELAAATAAPAPAPSPLPQETTGKVLAEAGVQKSRGPLVLVGALIGVAVVAVILWLVLGGSSEKPEPEAAAPAAAEVAPVKPAEPAPAPAAPDKAVQGLAARADDQPAPAPKPVAKPARKDPKPALTDEQQAAMKSLDNERGVGSHQPAGPEKAAEPDSSDQQGLTADQVRKKLDENKGALQGCIDEALKRDPNLRVGKIHIATTIAPSGQVTAAKIDKPTVDQSQLGSCLKRATRRIVFPTFGGDAFDVDIPIVVTASE